MPRASELAKKEIVLHIDGASRGNPGPAAYGVVAESLDGAPVAAVSKFLGEATNNQAEYEGDRKSTRLNSSHGYISYAVFCLKKKTSASAREPPGSCVQPRRAPRDTARTRGRRRT